jgi:uncharacterized protein with HEPN domain
MPSRRPELRFRDIVPSIDFILKFTKGMELDQFLADDRTRLAVERCLLIIREAGRKLGPEAEARCPEIPWGQVRGLGNWLRHDYDQMDYSAIWATVTEDLAALRAACQRQLKP